MPMDTENTPLLTPATAGLSSKILSEVRAALQPWQLWQLWQALDHAHCAPTGLEAVLIL